MTFLNWSPSGFLTIVKMVHDLDKDFHLQIDVCIRCWNALPADDVVNSSSVNISM